MSTAEFTICGDIEWDTPGAVLFSDGVNRVWLSRRFVRIRPLSNGHEFTMPLWLAKKKGLTE